MDLSFSRQLLLEQISKYVPLEVNNPDLRPSAVMLLICEIDQEEKLIFQSRSHHVRHHKGEISLPGGAKDPEDMNLMITALRETQEEIGINPNIIDIIVSDTEKVIFSLAEKEVIELLDIPIDYLLSEESKGWKMVDNQGVPSLEEGYIWNEHIIWGATARIVRQFIDILYKDKK